MTSRVDYCNAILAGAYKSTTDLFFILLSLVVVSAKRVYRRDVYSEGWRDMSTREG